MTIWLVDVNPDMVEAWKKEFQGADGVVVQCGDILEIAENTVVSPANSYGFMDGGIDRAYTDFFGLKPQEEIQRLIASRPEGFLPVGAAVLVKTGNRKIPYMIAAPTMMTPGQVNAANAFFAMSAILRIAGQNRDIVEKLFCPGLATGVGGVSCERAAKEMATAYWKWKWKSEDRGLGSEG